MVSISKIGGDLTVSIDGDIFGLRDGIEIGNEWNGNPVIPPIRLYRLITTPCSPLSQRRKEVGEAAQTRVR